MTMLALGLGSLVLAFSVALASIVVKVYTSTPQCFITVICHLCEFLFSLTATVLKIIYVVLGFLYSAAFQVAGPVYWVFHTLYVLISCYHWIGLCIIRGLLGLESPAMNSLSWVVCFCAIFLYLDHRYHEEGEEFIADTRTKFLDFFRLYNRNDNNNDNNNNRNGNPDHNIVAAEVIDNEVIADQLLQENQLLEIENRENENEENALEEADRNRVNIDNVQNNQRELDRDRAGQQREERVEQPAVQQRQQQRRLIDLDSSDDEIDPSLCSVCLQRPRGSALFPCGHTYLCRMCARIIITAERPCPICQTPIQEFRNVYL